ncbi:cobalamin biosynthesis protein, partial [Escherichia coli]|nr:cobalamin biosynthesis protein [Escherichia coli]
RDPQVLDEAAITRAAIESLAENTSDGIIAPAFWFALLGLPGLLAYKMLNTADSMIGHLNDRHRDFGR